MIQYFPLIGWRAPCSLLGSVTSRPVEPLLASKRNLQRLLVSYSPPLSDGGEEITSYWVELDPTPTFDDPITEAFPCPNSPDYATWVVETSTTDATTNEIVGG